MLPSGQAQLRSVKLSVSAATDKMAELVQNPLARCKAETFSAVVRSYSPDP